MQGRTPEIARCGTSTDEEDELQPRGVRTHPWSITLRSDGTSVVRGLGNGEAVFPGALRLIERGISEAVRNV